MQRIRDRFDFDTWCVGIDVGYKTPFIAKFLQNNRVYGIAVYGTWFVPCGTYVDLMAKYNCVDNDFDGEVNGKATLGQSKNTFEADLGGSWFGMRVGANFNWTKNTYTYIDFERTNGGDVKENYRWNIGVHHNF